ncbi:MAG: DNA gyrase C-terminal beta-propeller domain-containing protein, partial [Muribaculaceae bacterium]
DNDLVIINRSGTLIRIRVADIKIAGRNTQGVRLINLERRGDEIASVCPVPTDPEEETNAIDGEEIPETPDTDVEDVDNEEIIDDDEENENN